MLETRDQNLPKLSQTSPGDIDSLGKTRPNKRRLFFIAGIIIFTSMGLGALTISLSDNFIHMEDQLLGEPFTIIDKIIIDKAVLNKPGFVVVRNLKFFVGQNRNKPIITVSIFLEKGVYRNIVLDPTINEIDFTDGYKVGDKIQASIYEDDGDGLFNEDLDKPAALFFGKKIQSTAFFK